MATRDIQVTTHTAHAEIHSAVPATLTLWQREVVRFLRQRSRVVGALATPVVFWALIGMGLGRSFRPEGAADGVNYLEFFFPGTIVMILLFTAIFSTISVIEDRKEGFLQAVMVSPAPPWSIVLGKILGGTTLAWLQAMLFCLFALGFDTDLNFSRVLGLIVIVFVGGFGLTGLGFLVAWPMESTQGYHAIMNLFLLPMWMLSGALFPASGAHPWLQWVMAVNPVTYIVAAVQGICYENVADLTGGHPPGLALSIAVMILFGAVTFGISAWLVHRPRKSAA